MYKYGYVLPGSSCPAVGLSGYTLGGGYGLMGRQLGLMIDNLLSITTVLANGSIVNASKE